MTQFERIMKSLTLEDVALYASDFNQCPTDVTDQACKEYTERFSRTQRCKQCWKDYLDSEVRDENLMHI